MSSDITHTYVRGMYIEVNSDHILMICGISIGRYTYSLPAMSHPIEAGYINVHIPGRTSVA